jgi:hypothetical protein
MALFALVGYIRSLCPLASPDVLHEPRATACGGGLRGGAEARPETGRGEEVGELISGRDSNKPRMVISGFMIPRIFVLAAAVLHLRVSRMHFAHEATRQRISLPF